jgi:hypothetical protein
MTLAHPNEHFPHETSSLLPELLCRQCGVLDTPALGPGHGPHAARALCRHCGRFLQWLSRKSPEARRRARQQALAARPPSAAQLAYLVALGDTTPGPASMWAASQRIDALLQKGVKP